MLLENMNYDYPKLLAEYEKRLRGIKEVYPTDTEQRNQAYTAVYEFFIQLCDYQPEAYHAGQALIDEIFTK